MSTTKSPKDSSASQQPSQPKQAPKNLDLPTPSTSRANKPQNPLHSLPATALFTHSRNGSNVSLSRRDRGRETERNPTLTPSERGQQHLPRANPPTASFSVSGPSGAANRPSLVGDGKTHTYSNIKNAKAQIAAQSPSADRSNIPGSSKQQDDFRADAVWAEMQRTLADVELSAMNSSHVFGHSHAKALEDLRTAQLGLAQAWAKSEADEGVDDEFGRDDEAVVGNMKGGVGVFASGQAGGAPLSPTAKDKGGHSRQGSTASNVSGRGGNLEEETERDIRLARKRREANDRYFKQVNKGVLDVVKILDDVASAMRRVEKESREIWNESSGEESEDLGERTETDASGKEEQRRRTTDSGRQHGMRVDEARLDGGRSRAATGESETLSLGTGLTGTESDILTESPESRLRS